LRRSVLFTSAALLLALTACAGGDEAPPISESAEGDVSEPTALSVESTYASVEDLAADLTAVGVGCNMNTNSPPVGGCDVQGGHLTFYVEPQSDSERRLAVHRSNPFGCGSAAVPGFAAEGRVLMGKGWMLIDTQGSPAIAAIESATGRSSEAICP
jgi:hypothetical protein